MNLCVIIPVFNHERAVAAVVAAVRGHHLPCLLVDDGSTPACAAVLDALAQGEEVTLLRLPENRGKGGGDGGRIASGVGGGF